jgi:hypothetical protein
VTLTRDFKATVRARVERDPAFRRALFGEVVQALLEGDTAGGRSVLRDYINATIGFDAPAEITDTPSKSLMRMFGPRGNPTAGNLLCVIGALREITGVHLEVRAVVDA